MTLEIATSEAAPSGPDPRSGLAIDRWVLWPAIATTAIVSCSTFLSGLPGGIGFLTVILDFLLVYPVIAIALLASALVFALKKCPRKALSALIALAIPIILIRPINYAADCLHLALTVELGIGQNRDSTATADGRFLTWDWSAGIVSDPLTFLIYDASDEIGLPRTLRKHFPGPQSQFVENGCKAGAQHLVLHYYVCTFDD